MGARRNPHLRFGPSDFWSLDQLRDGAVLPLCPHPADFGVPQWTFGASTYAFVGPTTILATFSERGIWRLASIDTTTGALTRLPSPYTWISAVRGAPERAVIIAASATEPPAVVELEVATGRFSTLRRSTELEVDPADVSAAEALEFPTARGLRAHAFYYRPKNRDFVAPPGERPPLIVRSHGGPTSSANPSFSLQVQFWTSRGFAFLYVNYGGSTGYGRAYRERLDGQWGIVDVEDCEHGARHLVALGDVDGDRLVITGGSAGGYTTLRALTRGDVFRAGASHSGISDLEQLASDCRTGNNHKFESRYEDVLIAPLPERADVYRDRSPIHHADRVARPVIFFQGLDDRVFLPNQSERMVAVLREKKIPVAYLAFEGESHGFRRAENIKRALDAELYFYGRVLGFTPADAIEPVPIENL